MNKYYDVSPEELIYMLPDEHHKLHNEKQNERYTKEARMKMSEKQNQDMLFIQKNGMKIFLSHIKVENFQKHIKKP